MYLKLNFFSPRHQHKRNKAQIYDGMVQIYFSVFEARQNYIVVVVVVVCSGFTSLSTIFQSYHDGVWLRQGAQCSLL